MNSEQNNFLDALFQIVPGGVKTSEPLASHTHFGLGGPADFFVEAKTKEEIIAFVSLAKEHGVQFFLLGGGTNTLVRDEGFRGLVIKMTNREIVNNISSALVTADAGATPTMLARQTAEDGLSGLEWMISLPGTIGGAVRGNAGCFGGEVKDTFVSAEVLDTESGDVKILSSIEMEFGYRESAVKHRPWIVLSATFQLEKSKPEVCTAKLNEILKKRLESQPKNEKCAGCAFKNFNFKTDDDIAKLKIRFPNLPQTFINAKRIPAGWLIDQLELKGTSIGGARVSDIHGNFIVNDGSATADHILQLLALLKTRVRNETGVQLEEEIQVV